MTVLTYGVERTCPHGEPKNRRGAGIDCPACDPFNIDISREPNTDLGNARRLVAAHGRQMRYAPPWKKWLVWDGKRWARDITEQHHRWAKEVIRGLSESARRIDDEAKRKAVLKAAQEAESAARIGGMLQLARTERGVAIDPADLDDAPDLLNTQNWTVSLPSGASRRPMLKRHDPADNLTKVAAVDYDETAEAPLFDAFLKQIQPDAEMRAFLQRLLGHSLSGQVREHILPIFHGVGANGKSTLVEVCRKVLGDYAASVDPGLLIDRGEQHPTGVADLFGLRLALTHESDQGRRLAEGTIKRLTGGDAITARRMREDFWTFQPTHSLIMVTNHAPIVTGTDEGIWRRLRIVPFEVIIPPDERDGELPEKLFAEGSGILRWMVDGYLAYLREGLAAPEAVEKATSEYRETSDMLGLFLSEKCIQQEGAFVGSDQLFKAWQSWCERENLQAGSGKSFSTRLQERGFDKGRTSIGIRWKGLGLANES